MENSNTCSYCEKPYPSVGYFCGGCLNQFKCKSCDKILEKDSLGCTMCGEPKDLKREIPNLAAKNANTFRLHESLNERTIEATFSDNVGKEFAGIISDSYQSKIKNIATPNLNIDNGSYAYEDQEIDAELLANQETPIIKVNDLSIVDKDIPTIMLVAINNLPSTEMEWVIVYSFYASNYGKDIYVRKSILDKHYESKRKNNSVSTNLTRNLNLAINAGYVNPLHDGFALLPKGVAKAEEIISRATGSAPKVQTKSKVKKAKDEVKNDSKDSKSISSVGKTPVKTLKRLSDLNFFPDNKQSLKDFYLGYNMKNDFERILLFTYYLEENMNVDAITPNHIYTCFDELSLRSPENLSQTILNAKSGKGWIDKENSYIKITVKGRNKIKEWNRA